MNQKGISKEASAVSSVSAAVSVLGSWQICHTVCTAIIAALAIIGISINFMPLMFLTSLATPLWVVAVALFAVALYFYFTRGCIAKSLLVFNAGLIIAATPFAQTAQLLYWVLGGSVAAFGLGMFLRQRSKGVKREKK